MSYRDELIRRMKEGGEWDKVQPVVRGQVERLDDDSARKILAFFDGLDSPDGYLDDDETNLLAGVFLLSALQGALGAFDGKLFEFDPHRKLRPSELGHALLEFAAVAKEHGFATAADIVEHLSLLTCEALRTLQKFADSEQS